MRVSFISVSCNRLQTRARIATVRAEEGNHMDALAFTILVWERRLEKRRDLHPQRRHRGAAPGQEARWHALRGAIGLRRAVHSQEHQG